jgi:hypothetical protein
LHGRSDGNLRKERQVTGKKATARALIVGGCAFVSLMLAGAVGNARADDKWFVLGEQPIKSADQGVEIKSQGSFLTKDVKQAKLSVEGADVEIVKLILHWENRSDDTITDIGVLKSGGQTLPKDAPGRKARLSGATVQYKVLGGKDTATLKLWGYD